MPLVTAETARLSDHHPALPAGVDYRDPKYRREVFLRFYDFHLAYRSHPGGVYYLIPYLRSIKGWTEEETLWFATINGNTQHPLTSLILHEAGSTPDRVDDVLDLWRSEYGRLEFDTDRRYHKKSLDVSLATYAQMVRGDQSGFWRKAAEGGWRRLWSTATSIPTMGRLSAFSYLEYLRIAGLPIDCDSLMLSDRSGSKSHRNGICKVIGRDDLDWHDSNPSFDGRYSPATIDRLEREGASLLDESRRRLVSTEYVGDVSYLTLESALCTYKSWHRPNRRYANVYNDMLWNRIRKAETDWTERDWSVFWDARAATLPKHLLLEEMPYDPGLVPDTQNHYRETGEVILLDREYPEFANTFNDTVDAETGPRYR